MFENYFKDEMKRLSLKRYDVCNILDCTMPTLKSRLKNPNTFTIKEVNTLMDSGFKLFTQMEIFKKVENYENN